MLQVVICWENANLSLCCYAPSCHLLGEWQSFALLLCCRLSFVGKTPIFRSLAMLQVVICWKTPIFRSLAMLQVVICWKTPVLRSVAMLQVVICWKNANLTLCCYAQICHLLGKCQYFALLLNSKLSFVGKTPIFRSVATLQDVICWENANLTLCCYAPSCHLLATQCRPSSGFSRL